MQPAAPTLYSEMDSIFKILEDELRITLDLDGDDFDFQIIIPGILESTNADTITGDTLSWSFDLTDFMNEDYVMTAKSSKIYPARQKAGIVLFIILGFLFIGIRMRKKRID